MKKDDNKNLKFFNFILKDSSFILTYTTSEKLKIKMQSEPSVAW